MKWFSVLFFVVCLYSCQPNKKNDLQQIVNEWLGKKIQIPQGAIVYKSIGRDTLCTGLWNKPYKIFTYVDSVGCTSCRVGLSRWKELMDSCRIQDWDVGFLFVVHSNNYEKFERAVAHFGFDYPIIYDRYNAFNKLNRFPQKPYRTFLLDKDNKVLLIGSPIDNPRIWNLYKKMMVGVK